MISTGTFNEYFSNIGKELPRRIPHSNKGFEEYTGCIKKLNTFEIALNLCKAARIEQFFIQIDYFGTCDEESMKKLRNLCFHMARGVLSFITDKKCLTHEI